MKLYAYRLSFIPRIPMPYVSVDNNFTYDGSFFLIAQKPMVFTDFQVSDISTFKGIQVHVSHEFNPFLNPEEETILSITHAHFTQLLASNVIYNFYNDYRLYLIPVMKMAGKSDWEATLEWTKIFTDPPTIATIFNDLLIRHDRKNNGAKLLQFFTTRGEWINKFIKFVMEIDEPISSFIQNTKPINNNELTKPELVALFSALKLQEQLVDRIIKKEKSHVSQYSIIKSVSFNITCESLSKGRINYSDYLEHDSSQFIQNLPLLDITKIEKSALVDHSYYYSLTEYPRALSKRHQRIIEVIENRKFISDLIQRMPDDFECFLPSALYPMEISFLTSLPPIHISIAFLLNRISEQVCPILSGHKPISMAINDAFGCVRNNFLYRFRNLTLLRTALTDPELSKYDKKSISDNSRLAVLGESILNLIVTNSIFIANKTESVHRMAKLRTLILGGEFFRLIIEKIGLGKFYLSHEGGPNAKLTTKSAKNLMCALFGAIFMDSSLKMCYTSFKFLVNIDNKSIAESIFQLSQIGLQTLEYIKNLELDASINYPATENPLTHESICRAINYDIPESKLPIFQAAFTHTSIVKYQPNDKLAFFGEAFSKFFLTMIATKKFPLASADDLQYIVYSKMKEFGKIAIKKNISQLTLVQSGYEEMLNPSNDDIPQIHCETLYAVIAALVISVGYNAAAQYIHQELITVNWSMPYVNNEINELENMVLEKVGILPEYQQYVADGSYYTFMSLGDYRVPVAGIAKDPIVSKFELINSVLKVYESDPNTILTSYEYDDLEMTKNSEGFQQRYFNGFES
ncbi:hypothetical protein TRFO_18827 [Tritrichomonas foetus]|uniref:RNase III domain-containing protein n=1 Tax=Tritrichomonas foetus TaxID=1144522 RepID=A0A1J4KJV0_9EUKA|nr:hypothetical protein TRFO_18827 [Tritrichomonas foetus]|eukprot:OHT11585.1 hypothetical protein TRFO_18827 [Tritrichomonas foetus]